MNIIEVIILIIRSSDLSFLLNLFDLESKPILPKGHSKDYHRCLQLILARLITLRTQVD